MTALTGLRHTWATLTLWAKIERRARTARHDGAHVTTTPALAVLDATTDITARDARAALAYRTADPLAVTLAVSVEDATLHLVLARDLFATALATGTAGDGPLRLRHFPETRRFTLTFTRATTTGTRLTIVAFPARRIRKAVRAWYKAVPLGAEHVDLADHFSTYLRTVSPR